MSKSLGNVVEPQELIRRYGADILRLWVFSLDYRDDTPISEEILARCAEAYRKIRNTARYLISNLYDFDPARDAVAAAELLPLDAWALRETRIAAARMREAYERYDFHVVYHTLVNLCATALSAVYLDVVKDRLYASAASSPQRRSAQTAMHRIGRAIATAAAPVLVFTADEIWKALPGKKEESVHIAGFEDLEEPLVAKVPADAWMRLMQLREEAARILEEARRNKAIGSSLEGAIALTPNPALEADRAATRHARKRTGRPLHRLRSPRRRRLEWDGMARFGGVPGAAPRLPEGARAAVRPLLEGHARGRVPGPLRPLPLGRRRDRRMSVSVKESTLYRGAYLTVSLAVLFLDQWTKGLVTRTMEVHQSKTIISDVFDLTYVRNTGAAFGLFASVDSSIKAIMLNSIAVIVFLIVSAYALRSSHKSVRLQVGLALILGGAVGNLLDRVRFGYVVDFLDFAVSGHHWPAFNVADSAICIGVALLFLDMLGSEDVPVAGPTPAPGG